MTKDTRIQDLCVVDFRDDSHTPETKNWKLRNLSTKVFRAEACARQIWVGSKERFDNFPELQYDPRNQRLEGKEGYKQLLRYMLGIVNEGKYDPAAEKRFFDGWSAINRTCPQYAEPYNIIVANLVADSGLIKKNFLSQTKPERPWLIARDLAGHKVGDTALLVGDMDVNGTKLSPLTKKMSITLNGREVEQAGQIYVTHPDIEMTGALEASVINVFEEKMIEVPVEGILYEKIPELVEEVDQLYITMDSNEQPEAYTYLMNAWLNRSQKYNKLIDLKNSLDDVKSHMSVTSKAIKNGGVLWLDSIRDEKEERVVFNREAMGRAQRAIEFCGEMRVNQQEPSAQYIKGSLEI